MHQKYFLGVWSLIEYKIYDFSLKKFFFPFGKKVVGYLIYTKENYVSVHLMPAQRPRCSSENFQEINLEEKIEISENYGGYSGRYEINGSTIIHYPEVSSFPNLIDCPQVRNFSLHDEILTLSYNCSNNIESQERKGIIIWKRCSEFSV